MRVILFRHGIALDTGAPGIERDFDRPLSPDGWRKTRKAAAGLVPLLSSNLRIVASPLVRAQETAQCLQESLVGGVEIETCDALSLWADRDGVLAHIHDGEDVDDVVLVGHQPDMGSLASWFLLGGEGLGVDFKKAAALCVAFPGRIGLGRGHLAWYLPPRVLRGPGSLTRPSRMPVRSLLRRSDRGETHAQVPVAGRPARRPLRLAHGPRRCA